MYYLSTFQKENNRAEFMFGRKKRSDVGKDRPPYKKRKKKEKNNVYKNLKESKKLVGSINRTSEEIRGWTNTLFRIKKYLEGN